MKYLVIADSHISPTSPDIESWHNLGEYVVKTRPDIIIHLGDVADMDSLSWLKNSRGPYSTEEEMECVSAHLFAFEDVLLKDRQRSRQMKKRIYRPQKILCLGNHDVRNGFTGIDDLFTGCDWDVFGYLTPVSFEGDEIFFSHCMLKGTSSQACTTAAEIIENWHGNIVVGHSHLCDYAESYNLAIDKQVKAIKCPCFSNSRRLGEWATQSRMKWSTGFTEIETDGGDITFCWRPMSCLVKSS